jgi:hypothetical protein
MTRARSTCAWLVLMAVAVIAIVALPAGAEPPGPGLASEPDRQPPRGPAQSAPQPAQPRAQGVATPKPYKVIPVTLPRPSNDPSFAAFRNQILDIADRKDRVALASLVVNNFFWMGENGDKANKKKSGIDNLAKVAELDAKDGSGWEALSQVVGDPTLEPFPARKGVTCSPAGPTLNEKAANQVAKDTGTRPEEWGYTIKPGLDAHAAAQSNAPVVEKLAGVQLIRVMPEDAPGAPPTFVRVVTPSGKVGFIRAEFVKTFPENQICYVKNASGWKIAGLIGE